MWFENIDTQTMLTIALVISGVLNIILGLALFRSIPLGALAAFEALTDRAFKVLEDAAKETPTNIDDAVVETGHKVVDALIDLANETPTEPIPPTE